MSISENRSNRPSRHCLLPILMTFLAVSPVAATNGADWHEIAAGLEYASIDVEMGRTVGRMRILAGPASIDIISGVAFPANPAGGGVREVVFLGRGKIRYSPGDPVEKGQLRLFSGSQRLDETFEKAVLVLANQAAVDALLSGAPLPAGNSSSGERAISFYEEWRSSPERKRLNVNGRILTDIAEQGRYDEYFAGWFDGSVQGRFHFSVEPGVREQVALGQFVPWPLSKSQKRYLRRIISRDQDKGRSRGFDVSDAGDWDDWVSTPLTDANGTPTPGKEPFEAVHYTMDVRIARQTQEVSAVAEVEIQAMTGGRSVVPILLSSDMGLDRVLLGSEGPELFHYRSRGEILIFLPQAPDKGDRIRLKMETSGRVIQKETVDMYASSISSLVLRDTIGWHPRVGSDSRATYDVRFTYPDNLDLVASGRLVDGGKEDGGFEWQQRRIETPVLGFTFEVGDFNIKKFRAGHVEITLALDPVADLLKEISVEEIEGTIVSAIDFFEDTYGPYPLDYMTFATKPRPFSQGLMSMLTLSSYMLAAEPGRVFASQSPNPTTIIAHEISHQWWGNIIGWRSYRDQWISEAMANYSAVLFARERLDWDDSDVRIGPTANWRSELGEIIRRDRTVESMGPVTLGGRLISSRSRNAYAPIVYKKGAVVLDMLARWFDTEERFLSYMRRLVNENGNRTITTDEFVAALSRYSGTDLSGFAKRYIHGTGIPEIYYSLRIESTPEGRWAIRGEAVQRSPLEFRYRIGRNEEDVLDVFRVPVERFDPVDNVVISPLHIAVVDPDAVTESKRSKGTRKNRFLGGANAVITGRLKLEGERTELEIPIDLEPKGVWLDVNHEVFCTFYDSDRYPKQALLYEGEHLLAQGEAERAEAVLRQALGSPFRVGDDLVHPELRRGRKRAMDKELERALNRQIRIHLTRLCIDQGRLEESLELIKMLDKLVISDYETESEVLRMQSRLDLRRGAYRRILDRLQNYTGNDENILTTHGPEAYALLAIASKQVGDREIYRKALRQARRYGVDVTELVREQ